MARRVVWAGAAWIDLEEIAEYIQKDSPSYAAALVREMREASRTLSFYSERGRIIPGVDDPAFRELILGHYRMLYRVLEEEVRIIGIVHTARDFQRYWRNRSGNS